MKRDPGFMSYTQDPSLRRHHFGAIESFHPRRGFRNGVALALTVGLIAGFFILRAYI